MKIGVISDIHANLPALKAVLNDMEVDKIICCGDLIGYGPHPLKVVKKVREESDIVIQGNHDRWIVKPNNYNNPEVVKSLRLAQNRLMDYHIKWLDNLPKTKKSKKIVTFHSHPREEEKRIYPEDTHKFLKFYDNKIIIYGHTHIPCAKEQDNLKILNPGSVGQPRDEDSRASYGIIDSGKLSLERVNYNKEKTIQDIKENEKLPNSLSKRLI